MTPPPPPARLWLAEAEVMSCRRRRSAGQNSAMKQCCPCRVLQAKLRSHNKADQHQDELEEAGALRLKREASAARQLWHDKQPGPGGARQEGPR